MTEFDIEPAVIGHRIYEYYGDALFTGQKSAVEERAMQYWRGIQATVRELPAGTELRLFAYHHPHLPQSIHLHVVLPTNAVHWIGDATPATASHVEKESALRLALHTGRIDDVYDISVSTIPGVRFEDPYGYLFYLDTDDATETHLEQVIRMFLLFVAPSAAESFILRWLSPEEGSRLGAAILARAQRTT